MRILSGSAAAGAGGGVREQSVRWYVEGHLDSMQTTGKPDVYLLADGEYTCSSCIPGAQDEGGRDRAAGHRDTRTTTRRWSKSSSPTLGRDCSKQGGKGSRRIIETVSADGMTLTGKFKNHIGAKVITGEVVAKRVAGGPAGLARHLRFMATAAPHGQ